MSSDFPHSGTRELTAEDYIYQIKRLAHPRLHSPVFGLMSEYIAGMKEFAEALKAEDKALAASTPGVCGFLTKPLEPDQARQLLGS